MQAGGRRPDKASLFKCYLSRDPDEERGGTWRCLRGEPSRQRKQQGKGPEVGPCLACSLSKEVGVKAEIRRRPGRPAPAGGAERLTGVGRHLVEGTL